MNNYDPAIAMIAALTERGWRLKEQVRWLMAESEEQDAPVEPTSLPREGNVVYLGDAPKDD